MKNNKICFISCVNDEDTYNECVMYIKNLNIPIGMEVEIKPIREANSINEGYNEAMNSSDAKYKVYLHQDVFIINKNFINYIVEIFKKNQNIGLLGMIGAATVPTSCKWWESINKYGKVYESHTGKMELLKHKDIDNNTKEVKAVDGFIMVTQYDVTWREDIFDGWHFYDVSQCIEFKKYGYKVAIPRQNEPWCIHDCGFVETTGVYDKYREIFLKEYSKVIFPLCTIMITSYNRPNYFKLALESAINQSYLNTEIIICDNSTNDKVKNLMKNYDYENVRYYKNEKELEVIENFNKCINLTNSNYICFLMDDDLYHTDKLNVMMNYFIEDESLSIVTSHRQVIDLHGKNLHDIFATKRLFENPTIINETQIKEFTIKTQTNFWGETTTPIFKKSLLQNGKFGFYNERQYSVISDWVTWISMAEKGNLLYLPETLSYFRIHENQDQKKAITIIKGDLEKIFLLNSFLCSSIKFAIPTRKTLYYEILAILKEDMGNLVSLKDDIRVLAGKGIIEEYLELCDKLLLEIRDSNTNKDSTIKNSFMKIYTQIRKYYQMDKMY